MEKIVKKDKIINYEVVRTTKKKEYYLTSIKDGVVYISVPEYAENNDIKMVMSQQFYCLYNKMHPEERYVLHYLGKQYMVKCVKSSCDKVIVKENEITIKAIKITSRYYQSVLYKFFTKVVEEEIAKLMEQAKIDFGEIVIPKIVIKPIKGYLGYNYMDHIKISPVIAKYELKYFKVLLYHEICHSLVRGHKSDFWQLLDSKLPNGVALNQEMDSIKYNDYL